VAANDIPDRPLSKSATVTNGELDNVQSSKYCTPYHNSRHKELIERTYREVITDALEACFAFGIDDKKYTVNDNVSTGAAYQHAVQKAIEIEELDMKFCLDASEKSKHLMSDVPQAFSRLANKKQNRITELHIPSLICLDKR
jgi:hypothetical protein